MYERILHPDIFQPIMKKLSAVYDELKIEAFREAKISDRALIIEAKLKEMEDSATHVARGNKDVIRFQRKMFYKDLLKMLEENKF